MPEWQLNFITTKAPQNPCKNKPNKMQANLHFMVELNVSLAQAKLQKSLPRVLSYELVFCHSKVDTPRLVEW